MPDDPGCDLFVDAADDDAVGALIGSHFGVDPVLGFVSLPEFEVRVGRNLLARTTAADADDFLDWPTIVEVSGAPGSELSRLVADLTALLRSAGHRVVANYDPAPEK